MPYLGKQPASVPVTADDIPDNSITAAKIVDGGITAADIGADAVGLSELSATGTASTSTFLRGDNAWVAVDTNLVSDTSPQLGGNLDLNSNNITGTGGIPAANLTGTIAAARLSTATTQSASDNSTKIATTAYTDAQVATVVDSAPGTLNTLNELAAALGDDANFSTTVTNSIAAKLPLAGGAMTGAITASSDLIFDAGSDIVLDADGGKIKFRDGGSDIAYLENNSGDLLIKSITDDKDIKIQGKDGGAFITALKLDMSNAGAATFNSYADFQGNNIYLADNAKANFGTGEDLQIYHDGSHSYISDQGDGNLTLLAGGFRVNNPANTEQMIEANIDDAVKLYHNGTKKLETTATGIEVTGDAKATRLVGRGVIENSSGVSGDTWAVMGLNTTNAAGSGGAVFGSKHADSNALLVGSHDATFNSFAVKGDGKVGIGTTSPTNKFHVKGTGAEQINLETTGGATTILAIALKNSANTWQIENGRASNVLSVRCSTYGETIRSHSNGVTSFNAGIALGVGLNNTSSNVLDDYEEGTFTPTFVGGTNPTVTYHEKQGYYTKIGNLVYIRIWMRTASMSNTGTSTLYIDGLPFTVASSNQSKGGIAKGHIQNWGTIPENLFFFGGASSIYLWDETNGTTHKTNILASGADKNQISCGGFYEVA